jgi:hypothetical protein
MSLGFVNKKNTTNDDILTSSQPNSTTPIIFTSTTVTNIHKCCIEKLEQSQRNNQRKLDKIKELLSRTYTLSGEVRCHAIKLKSNERYSEISSNQPNLFLATGLTQPNINNIDFEWDQLLKYDRELRFGFDDMIREINMDPHYNNEIDTRSSTTPTDTITKSFISDPVEIDPYINIDHKFIVVARDDFIAVYLGQTAPKTRKVLESALGEFFLLMKHIHYVIQIMDP